MYTLVREQRRSATTAGQRDRDRAVVAALLTDIPDTTAEPAFSCERHGRGLQD